MDGNYRRHFDKDLDEFDNAIDKEKYVEESTEEACSKFLKHISNK